MFRSIIDWLRAGYPDEAPRTGPIDSIDIGVTITKATNRLPTQARHAHSPARYTQSHHLSTTSFPTTGLTAANPRH